MKNIFRFLIAVAAALGIAQLAAAQTQSTEATVAKVTGTVTVQLPGQAAVPLALGAKVSQGATITTGANSEVYLQTFTGAVATIKANTTVSIDQLSVTTEGGKVTKETTELNLKFGNLVAALDPAKKAVNNYQVRTPKGVAAARGTSFSVTYLGNTYTIVTTSGSVVITTPTGVITITGGQASVSSLNGGAATAVSELPAETKAEVIQAMAVAVATVAVAAENNMLGTAGSAMVRDAAATVVQAVPEAASQVAQLVAVSAPTQTQTVVETVRETAPQQLGAVEQAIRGIATPPTPTPPPQAPPPQTTAPQPIDPATVSRSS